MSLSNQLNFITAVSNLRAAVGVVGLLKTMYTTGSSRWDMSFDALTGDHLIKGVMLSSAKTDAVRIYVQTLVQLYMNSLNVTAGPLTKFSLSNENEITVAIIDRIATSKLDDHLTLFKLVVSRLLGIDPLLASAAVMNSDSDAAKALIIYLAHRSDEVGDPEMMQHELIAQFTTLYSEGKVTDEWFLSLIQSASVVDLFASPLDGLLEIISQRAPA